MGDILRAFLARISKPLLNLMLAAGAVGGCGALAWAKVETWRQEGAGAFAKAHRERVVVTDNGRVRLGHALSPAGTLAAERVWSLARGHDGAIYAATGDSGKVFRRPAKPEAPWSLVYDAVDSQVLSLAVDAAGTVYAGTGPGGHVVNISDGGHPSSRPGPKVQYIWALAFDSQGSLLAATGPDGQLWKRDRDGSWKLVYDSKAAHLLCLAIGPDGSIYAGSDTDGLIFQVNSDGKASILFDAPQAEVRALFWGGDGALYAGTAAESGGGGAARGSLFVTQSGEMSQLSQDSLPGHSPGAPTRALETGRPGAVQAAQLRDELAQARPQPSRPGQSGGSAAPRSITPGENAVYRLDSDGAPHEVLRLKALVHALSWAGDRLLVGTGPDGLLYEVAEHGVESTPLAKLDHGQILALLAQPDGSVLVGTGDPGSVVSLSRDYAAKGTLTSEVHDTKLKSRFGALAWRCDRPPGTSVAFQARTGNIAEPDETWSSWSPEQTDALAATAASPPGRFVQYRATLATNDPKQTPELRSVFLTYRTSNLAPEISRLDVPDLSALDGAARQTRLNLRWEATDPNDDDLEFMLKVRKQGWPDWLKLTDTPITEKNFAWDTTAFPSGQYRVKLIASDRPSNSADDAQKRELESVTFIVDHDPPAVQVAAKPGSQGKGAVVTLSDPLTRVVKAEYALDGGAWIPVFPDDGLFDTGHENITIDLPELKAGVHVLMVRATDSAGNIGSNDVLLDVAK
jgi:hypothetical protein